MKTENAKEFSEIYDGFSGLDLTSPIGSGKLSQLRNFRLLSDGSALKRGGFRLIGQTADAIRGAAAYVDGGEDVILAVSGAYLYRVTAEGAVSSSRVFDTEEGKADFFELRGELYIIDGQKIYRYAGGVSAEPCSPHAPLYGKLWLANNNYPGNQNEPLSLLTPRIRISYRNASNSISVLAVGLPIKSIDGLFVNGVSRMGEGYDGDDVFTIHSKGDRVSCENFSVVNDSEIVLYVTIDGEQYSGDGIDGCNRAAVFDSFSQSRVFIYGGNDSGRFYVSPTVDEATLAQETSVYGRVDPIYFPKGGAVRFGGMDGINGMCRMCNRMLIFSSHRSWITSSLEDAEGVERLGVSLGVLSSTVGCSSEKALRVIGGAKIVTVSRGGIFKWSFDSEFEEEAVISRISDKVEPYMSEELLKNAAVCYDRDSGELWFGNRLSEDGEVLVYDMGRGIWWLYDGICAEQFIETGYGIAFVCGNRIYLFDNGKTDVTEDGEREIVGIIESAGFDLSARSKKKQICDVRLLGELDGGSAEVEIEDGRLLGALSFNGEQASPIHVGAEFIDTRVSTSRTERARFTLRAHGKSRQRIYGLEFHATP